MSSKNGRDAHRVHSPCAPDSLRERLKVQIDLPALSHALTHRSYAHENPGVSHNERLEFLGDAVLEYVVTAHLFHRYPDSSEGDLVKLRAAIVSTKALASVARKIDVGQFIRLGHGELMNDGQNKESILADTLEAIIGAVFIDSGIDQARKLIHEHVIALLDDEEAMINAYDWKTLIQEFAQSHNYSDYGYEVTGEGPDHNRVFTATLVMDGQRLGQGQASSKREAEKRAAHESWKILRPGIQPPHV